MLSIDLTGKVAVITGGSSGIGLATAKLMAEAGASVAICGRSQERLTTAEDEILKTRADGVKVMAGVCDVLDEAQVTRFARSVAEEFGHLDMLINNAGQARVSTFADTTDAAWREELDLKFFSIIRPTRAFLPLLEKAASPAIVCVNSLLSKQPEPHMVATSAARSGVLSLTRSLAAEFAPRGIRVNTILLGLVESGQWRRRFAVREDKALDWEAWTAELAKSKSIPLGRLGRPEEAARAIFYLATELSSYTTGASLDVSGGLARHV